jgi:TM2 domain-containing membrane protein YozV
VKKRTIAYLLWIVGIFGCLGLHRFYLRKYGTGALWLVSFSIVLLGSIFRDWPGVLWLFALGFSSLSSVFDLLAMDEHVNEYNRMALLRDMAFRPIPEKTPVVPEPSEFGTTVIPELPPLDIPLISSINGETRIIGPELKALCPHCWSMLPRIPQRRTKCQFCKKEIFVRVKQTLFANVLLNKEDATVVDYLKVLEKYGVRESDYIREEIEISKLLGEEVSSSDVIWSLFKQAIDRTKDSDELTGLDDQMGEFLVDTPRDSRSILQRACRVRLLHLQEQGVKEARITVADRDSCAVCKGLDGKIVQIEHALKEMPIPARKCTHHASERITSFCRCDYQLPV